MKLPRGLTLLAFALAQPGIAAGAASVPVRVGGDPLMDACGSLGVVSGLDPRGDNFLSVRSGPGGAPFWERDRLHGGARLAICEARGAWLGIVYPANGRTADCGTATPRARATPYAGPCRSGWVHRRYVRIVAG